MVLVPGGWSSLRAVIKRSPFPFLCMCVPLHLVLLAALFLSSLSANQQCTLPQISLSLTLHSSLCHWVLTFTVPLSLKAYQGGPWQPHLPGEEGCSTSLGGYRPRKGKAACLKAREDLCFLLHSDTPKESIALKKSHLLCYLNQHSIFVCSLKHISRVFCF